MKNQHRTRTVRALTLAAVAAIPSLAARGQAVTSTWLPTNTSDNWSVAANWDRNAVPTSGTNTVLVFGGTGTASYIATQNVANPFTLNKLLITSTSSNPIVIGGTANQQAANTLSFSGTGASVVHSGTGNVYINAPLTLTSATTFDVQNAATNLYILSDFGATASAFTKTGAGTLVWGSADPTPVTLGNGSTVNVPARAVTVNLTGPININQGTVLIGNTGGSFLSNNSLVTVAAGATFDFNDNSEDFGSLAGAGTVLANGAGMTTGLDNRSATWSGQIVSNDLRATVAKNGTGTWTITTPQTYKAMTSVAGGQLTLSGQGAITSSTELSIGSGAKLRLDNTANNMDRINGENTLTMNGNSELVFVGNASTDSQQSVGLTRVRGLSTFTLLPGAGRSARLDVAAVEQEAGGTGAAENGMVLFRGNKLGATPGADTSNVFLFYPPTNLVGGNGGAGTTTLKILPFALSDTSATGSGNSLVTYDTATGIRPLNATTEFAAYPTSNAVDNVRIAAAASGLAGKTVNSLVVDNSTGSGFTVGGTAGQAVTVTSGAVLFSGNSAITLSGFDALNFDGNVAYISSANSAAAGTTIATQITGTNGIVKGGAGLLALTAANPYTGGTIVSAGTLKVVNDNNLGATSGFVAFNAGTLQLGADVTSGRQFTANTGGIGTIDTNGFTLNLTRIPNGAGQLVKAGAGTLVIPEFGGTNLGSINLNGGTIRVTKTNTTGVDARDFVLSVNATNTIDTNGFNASMGNTSGAGGFTKTGLGTLLMQGTNTFQGDITIAQGTVKINGTGGSFFEDPTYSFINAGATLDMSDNSEQWGGIAGAGTIITGTVAGVDVNVVGARDATFSGVIQGAGDLLKNGTATLTLSGQSSFTGPTTINSGALVVTANVLPGANGPLGNATSVIAMGSNAASPATLLIGQSGVTVGRGISVPTANTATVRLGSNHASGVSTFSGNIAMAKPVELTAAAGGQTDFTGVLSGAGTLSKTGAGVARLAGVNTYTGATTVTAGTLRIDGSASNTASLTVNNTGTFAAGSSQTIKSLVVNAGGKANIVSPASVLKVNALAVNTTGKVDVGTGMLVLDYTSPATTPAAAEAIVRTALARARGTGDWAGTAGGITSSAILDGTRAMGYAQASALAGPTGGTYNGATLDADAVVVRMTVAGDATMDGQVNFDDLLALAKNYNSTSGTWSTGDFDYSNVVNFDDLLVLAKNYNKSLAAPAPGSLPAEFQADVAAAFAAAVPEPSSAALVLAASGLVLSGRRRRRGC
jgi:autotransporter-associated beta strand protein